MEKKVVIIGSGMMGSGIGACTASAGVSTVIVDVSKERTEAGMKLLKENLKQLYEGI